MKRKNLLIIELVIALVASSCAPNPLKETLKNEENILEKETLDSLSDVKETTSPNENNEVVEEINFEEKISTALQNYLNKEVWFWKDQIWLFYFVNREVNYEYYRKIEYSEKYGFNSYIVVLFTEKVPMFRREKGRPLVSEHYGILMNQEEYWNGDDIDEIVDRKNSFSHLNTLTEYNDVLKEEGFVKVGDGVMSFEPSKEPYYGENSEDKLELVQNIALSFMQEIGSPEKISELYILNFPISRDQTQILYVVDNEYWETSFYFGIGGIGGLYNKPFSVSAFDDDGYYRSQFKQIAFTIDVTDIENPKIVSLPNESQETE